MFKYELGSRAKCKITGYEGMLIARTEWLYGCVRYTLQSGKLQESGEPAKSHSTDEEGLQLIEAAPPHELPEKGGDAPEPTRQADPSRPC